MPIEIHRSLQRGYFDHDWLKTFHTFSLGEQRNQTQAGFRSLRAINENWMNPGVGFPVQLYHDVEMFSIILEGGVTYQDSLGNGSIVRAGQIELMSAGRGMELGKFNASDSDRAHFYQFWIIPNHSKLKPSHQSKFFDPAASHNKWCLILSKDGREGSLRINQDISTYLSHLNPGRELTIELEPNRYAWLQVMDGSILLDGKEMGKGDGASISHLERLDLKALDTSKIILFDLN